MKWEESFLNYQYDFLPRWKKNHASGKAESSLSSLYRNTNFQNFCPEREEATKENAAPKVGNQKGMSDGQFKKILCTFLDSVTFEVFVSC